MAGYCDQCDRHCPLSNLGCGRGYRKYGTPDNTEDHRKRPDCTKHRNDHDEHHHDHGEHHRHGEHHNHGPHRHGPTQEELQSRLESGNLNDLMHMCAHVMHHRPEAGAARGQGKVMAILADQGSISQRQLQDMLHIQPGSLSEILTKLEAKGLLTRTRAEDKRGNILSITEEGRALSRKEDSSGSDLFTALSEAEQYQLRALLQTLLTDWLQRFDPRFHHNG